MIHLKLNRYDAIYISGITLIFLLFWPLGVVALAVYSIVLLPRARKVRTSEHIMEIDQSMSELYEVLKLVSNKQEIEIRSIKSNDFSTGKTIFRGLLRSFNPEEFRFILSKQTIGLAAISNTILIYIEQNS